MPFGQKISDFEGAYSDVSGEADAGGNTVLRLFFRCVNPVDRFAGQDVLDVVGICNINSHGLDWSINTQAQPTTKHESN
ncbi:hypothetical protein DO021_18425 [Desulfobacter hydrogenophilus]|uniref:Uncharacterized protein n=1 Tax=Desulfobacter hydrogenophilus TaxID=2291 RepID=A0A328FBR1_9BACT|nr:hypothetical protein [Desulfobacter hydrogenophilus]NDY73687.1 hypothetical protein [Desulfobacter hydrogenophilus]QBH11776.1 hypothetical protein EYB58_01845 [Desulfobacter hydrogenophilus]RAM00553.1 hypothetical protein DO021_18425 [Desulfobacter hydrogenophilus]